MSLSAEADPRRPGRLHAPRRSSRSHGVERWRAARQRRWLMSGESGRSTGSSPAPGRAPEPPSSALVLAPSSLVEACSSASACWSRGCSRTARCTATRSRSSTTSSPTGRRVWNHVTSFGTLLGGTETVIALTAVGCLVLALRGHGPRLPVFLAVAVAGETTLFVLASIVIDRLRPAIPHLDGAPPTSSFPSGHTAATVALWCGLALGLARTHPGPSAPRAQLGARGRPAGVRAGQPALPRHALADRRRRHPSSSPCSGCSCCARFCFGPMPRTGGARECADVAGQRHSDTSTSAHS